MPAPVCCVLCTYMHQRPCAIHILTQTLTLTLTLLGNLQIHHSLGSGRQNHLITIMFMVGNVFYTVLYCMSDTQSKQTNFVHGFMLTDRFLPCWLNNQTSALYTPLYIFAVSLQTGFSWQCTCSQTGLFLDCSSRKPFPVQTLSPCGPGWVGVSSLRASGLNGPPLLCPSA